MHGGRSAAVQAQPHRTAHGKGGEACLLWRYVPDVYWIGLNDRTTDLFEGIWPVAEAGVTYNSYVIRDEKNVIVDLAKGFKTDEYFELLESIVPLDEIDYIVINHMEPDHTGAIRALSRLPGRCTLLATEKAREMLAAFYGITENIRTVADGEELVLGQDDAAVRAHPVRALARNHGDLRRHRSDTVLLRRIRRIRDTARDDVRRPGRRPAVLRAGGPPLLREYRGEVQHADVEAIKKLSGVPIEVIAPSHGLVWRRDPGRIVELYRRWAELAKGGGEVGVTLVYGSMYGNTEKMMNAVAQGISRAGVPVEIFDAARDPFELHPPALWTNRGVMVGRPPTRARFSRPWHRPWTWRA